VPSRSDDIADAVLYILAQPRHVAVNETLVRPTEQQSSAESPYSEQIAQQRG
jgi:NADP-dependent 3-hydroxy acid dehydrogenase YdfG